MLRPLAPTRREGLFYKSKGKDHMNELDQTITDLRNRRLAMLREIRNIEDQLVQLQAEKRTLKLSGRA